MTHDWLVAMNVDVRAPQGDGGRTLLGHRLLLYNWIAKDPEFARRFRSAREFGEMMIAEQYLEVADSLAGMTMVGNTIRSSREFRRQFLRPVDLRLQRWRRHPRRRQVGL